MSNPQNNATMQVIAERINAMQNDFSDLRDTMRDSMEKISSAMTTLVKLEERQFTLNSSHQKLDDTLQKSIEKTEKLEARLDALEREAPLNNQARKWVFGAVWAVVSAAAVFIARTLGFV